MSDNINKCLVCRTLLPVDAAKSINTISCNFCGSPNPNPANLKDNKPAKHTGSGTKTRTINLNESPVSLLLSIVTITYGIIVVILHLTGNRLPAYYIAISSVITFLPVFVVYFVPAHWKRVCKWATAESGEKYQISYSRLGADWANYLESIIFQVWFLGMFLSNIFNPRDSDSITGTWFLALVLGIVGIFIYDLIFKTLAEILGTLIYRPK